MRLYTEAEEHTAGGSAVAGSKVQLATGCGRPPLHQLEAGREVPCWLREPSPAGRLAAAEGCSVQAAGVMGHLAASSRGAPAQQAAQWRRAAAAAAASYSSRCSR